VWQYSGDLASGADHLINLSDEVHPPTVLLAARARTGLKRILNRFGRRFHALIFTPALRSSSITA
jgi:hypothetical protein